MKGSEGTNVKVAVRCRPFTDNEKAKAATRVVKMSGEKIIVHNPQPGSATKEHSFNFDHSYFWEAKSEQLYHDLGAPILNKAMSGYNVTLLAYGQTSTGKTFSMKGSEEEPGIIPLLNQELFKQIDEAPPSKQFFVTVSYYEIYQESINDLLNPSGYELRVRQHPQLGIYVEGLAELVVQNAEDISKLYEQGNRVRKLASADKSKNASRSDSIFTINVEQRNTDKDASGAGIRSKITLVDMAGSERSDNTEISVKQGAVFFNKGVNALNSVISTLAVASRKEGHVPYRDSKITRILQDSLGGTSYTTMLVTVSPADSDFEDTLLSLQCGSKMKNVNNMVRPNEIENTKIIKDIREEITRLREKLARTGITSGPNKEDVLQMEELIKDLQTAKRQTWDERERISQNFDEERRLNLANKGILDWVMDTMKRDNKEVQERLMVLQKEKDQLTTEFKEKRKMVDELKDDLQGKITEYSKLTESGKGGEDELKSMVATIHNIKEKLKGENDELKKIKHKLKEIQEKQKSEKEEAKSQTSFMKGNSEFRHKIEAEQREKVEKENAQTLADEVDRIKMEIEQEKADLKLKAAEGAQYTADQAIKLEMDVVELKAERSIMSMKISTLENEKKRLKADLEDAYKTHKEEMEIQQLQHFQTFRNYREVFEEQKAAIEQRYRTLLEEAIQDAVFLSTRNQELMQENQSLQQEIAEMKDQLSLRGNTED